MIETYHYTEGKSLPDHPMERSKRRLEKLRDKANADTIALFSKRYDNFLMIKRGDVTKYLENHSSIPVFTFNLRTMTKKQ